MVGVLLGEPDQLGEWLADAAAFDAAGADALWVECADERWDVGVLAGALAVVTFRSRLVVAAELSEDRTLGTLGRLSRGRFALMGEEEGWERVPAPEGRDAWRAVCAQASERGVAGIVVPAGPRLLDILRNPEDPGERHDLQIAQG